MSETKDEVFLRQIGRVVAGAYYDYQGDRLRSMNQIRALVRAKNEGIDLNQPEQVKAFDEYQEDGQEPTDGKYSDAKLWKIVQAMKDSGTLNDEEFEYLKRLEKTVHVAHAMEDEWEKVMRDYIEAEPIWAQWLVDIRGISTVLTANMLRNWGYCENSEHPSSLWRFCGLHLVCPQCIDKVIEPTIDKKGNLKEVERIYAVLASDLGKCPRCGLPGVGEKRRNYIDPETSKKTGIKLSFNPKQRVLAWKIVDSFIKQRTPYYRDAYDAEKTRQLALMESHAPAAPVSLLHADRRARRKTVKLFLAHYWFVSRTIKGLPTEAGPYVEEKLKHTQIVMPQRNNLAKFSL